MKKLHEQTGWYARVYVESKIKQDLIPLFSQDGMFPFDIGAVTLTSKDGKRNYILDTYHTEYCTDKHKVGEVYTFHCRLEEDFDTFPQDEDYNYNLTVEDLKDCTGEFYCSQDDDYLEDPEMSCIFWMNGGYVHTHEVKLKQD
jgi:hypothetical protein